MKRFIAGLAALSFGVMLLSAPTVALSVPGNTCNPPAGHGRSGCHVVTPPVSVPGTATVTSQPSGRASIKVRRTLALGGTVSSAQTGGTVTIVKTRLVGRTWKKAGSATVPVVDGAYAYAFKPTKKGRWRFVAKYSGTWDGTAGWAASKSGVKNVRVK